jgi:ABC-type nitrate/sulfonate/bicarbonate transport system substrate-binding protein
MKMKMMMKNIITLVLICIGLGACAKNAADGKTDGNEQIRIVLDWTPNTNHTGIYAAREKGYFAEEGIELSILMPPEDGAILLLASGKAEFAVDFQESLGPAIGNKDPLPVKAVAAVISHNTSGLMSLQKAGIKRPRDLEGRRFASWETPLVSAVIKNIVEGDGGDFSKSTDDSQYGRRRFFRLRNRHRLNLDLLCLGRHRRRTQRSRN